MFTGVEKSVFILISQIDNAKEYLNYCTILLISYSSKIMLKILQARLQQYTNLKHPDVQAWLEKTEEREIKLLYNCNYFTCQQGNAQHPSSQSSIVSELRTSRCTSWIQKRQRNQRPNCQDPLDHRKSKRIPENVYFCFIDYAKAFDCVSHNKLWKIHKEMGIPDHLTCLLRNLYAGQEATVRTMEQRTGSKLGKVLCQGCILPPCSFNLYVEHIMRNTGLGEITSWN